MPLPSPLVATDRTKLNQAMASLNELRIEIDKAKSANVDVSEAELRMNDLYGQIEKLKASYFPNLP